MCAEAVCFIACILQLCEAGAGLREEPEAGAAADSPVSLLSSRPGQPRRNSQQGGAGVSSSFASQETMPAHVEQYVKFVAIQNNHQRVVRLLELLATLVASGIIKARYGMVHHTCIWSLMWESMASVPPPLPDLCVRPF